MTNRALSHLRSNAVAYLALFVALGGTSYAALDVPRNSVGAAQIKNHVIEPVKLNRNYIDGNVRLWASVNAAGKIVAGGTGMTVTGDVLGDYIIEPRADSSIAAPRGCAVIATVDDHSSAPGYATAESGTYAHRPRWTVVVETHNVQGQDVALPFDFAVIC